MWPSTSLKNIAPYFCSLGSLSFSTDNIILCKQIESVKCTFAARTGSRKPAFLHALFLENESQTVGKIMGQCFPIKSKVTCKNSWPKKSLRLVIQVLLHLIGRVPKHHVEMRLAQSSCTA